LARPALRQHGSLVRDDALDEWRDRGDSVLWIAQRSTEPRNSINTGARLTSGRLNIDQSVGDKLTLTAAHSVAQLPQNGVGGNNNNGTNPMYWFAYEPAIYDISKSILRPVDRCGCSWPAAGRRRSIRSTSAIGQEQEETCQLGTVRANIR
jgi:hypothetical protein